MKCYEKRCKIFKRLYLSLSVYAYRFLSYNYCASVYKVNF
jgi:hypothetical protein